jgi:hypothetical protein
MKHKFKIDYYYISKYRFAQQFITKERVMANQLLGITRKKKY